MQVNENRWLRWEVDRLTKLYNADQIHIYDLETMLNPLQADNQKLEAAMSTLQAERDCLMKRLAFNRRATKVSKVWHNAPHRSRVNGVLMCAGWHRMHPW